MARKIFMSVLGTGFYDECSYFIGERSNAITTRFVQEAAIKLLCSNWDKEDMIIIYTTKKAYKENYDEGISTKKSRGGEEMAYHGLEKILKELNLKPLIKNEPIDDGNNEEEIWKIFNAIYSNLKEDDEVYFDITHSFRYLPMLLLVLLNYSEFLKNTKLKSITYGNYELSRDNDGFAPIMDLMSLVRLKDWSLAVSNFEQFGDVKKISELCQTSLKPVLAKAKGKDLDTLSINNFSKDLPEFLKCIQTCRGNEIIKGERAIKLFTKIENVEQTSLAPFNPIFSRLKNQVKKFSSENNVKNGFAAVAWCISNGLIQQGFTLLQETIISLVCESEQIEFAIENNRNIVSAAFNIKKNNRPESEWISLCKSTDENLHLSRKITNNHIVAMLASEFCGLTAQRNDINHAGMKTGYAKADSFEKNLKEIFCSVMSKTCNL